MVELIALLQWFNPVVRLLKKEIRKIHEFQADAEVLKTGIDATKYQLLLLKKTVNSGPYTFVNSFNHNKLKIRFIMMSKKKSNSWARLKLLLLLPLAALSVYACARPEGTQHIEQVISREDTSISSNSQDFTLEFFESELNRYISELGGRVDMSLDDKRKFLTEKTNMVNLFVNMKDQILFNSEYCTIEQLPSDLAKILVANYPNKKPVLINYQFDLGTSTEAKNKILNIVGQIFIENEELFKQKNQPVLLYKEVPKMYQPKVSSSGNSTETQSLFLSFMDGAGKELRSFTFENKNPVNGSIDLDYRDTFDELKEWLISQKDNKLLTLSIKASPETPMGVITDLKQLFRDIYALKIEHKAVN